MIEEILTQIPKLSQKEKEKLDKALSVRPRVLALAVIRREDGALLLAHGVDSGKNDEVFYRPLGGGVDYGEHSRETVKREMLEETGCEVEVGKLLGFVANIFTYAGRLGHEVVFLYETKFVDRKLYEKEVFPVIDSKGEGEAVWRTPQEIVDAGEKLYPVELADLV
jgi:8-oxo-dGTP pyrophosphatase MutT (NUDIX family)